ncbi:hypothetical protein ACP4OV_007395 [Aristida adscensionis]
MWAFRRFLMSRPRALLSQLHPIGRRLTKPPPMVPGAASLTTLRRHVSGTTDGGGDSREDPVAGIALPTTRKKHLYLVLDDTEDGFGIHRLDLDGHAGDVAATDDDDDDDEPGAVDRLPEPTPTTPGLRSSPSCATSRAPYPAAIPGQPWPLAAGCSATAPCTASISKTTPMAAARTTPRTRRTARRRRIARTTFGHGTPTTPGNGDCAGATATLVDGFPSPRKASGLTQRTRTAAPSSSPSTATRSPPSAAGARDQWTRHGDWELPFRGQAHYDGELGAWVGVHGHRGGGGINLDVRLCACRVPAMAMYETPAPDWKLCKEKLFNFRHDPERHVDAKLVPMGRGGRFCLVEVLAREGFSRECLGGGDKCVLRLTTFGVKYGGDGELVVTSRRRAATLYVYDGMLYVRCRGMTACSMFEV